MVEAIAKIDNLDLMNLMQNSLSQFFKEHQINEVLPDNAKVLSPSYSNNIDPRVEP